MAKAPLPGRAKTRLAPQLGLEGAARVAQRLLHHALASVQTACASDLQPGVALRAELCGSPVPGHSDWVGCLPEHWPLTSRGHPPEWVWTDQGEGDLGQRMARASQRVTAAGEAVLLVGTDCPGLGPALLRQTATHLLHHGAVMLPARDGGYVALGLRDHCPQVFADMSWSTAAVARITRQRLQAQGLDCWQGPLQEDVDDWADLQRLAPEFPELFDARWLEGTGPTT